jgi:hypothetical protein
MKEAAKDVSEDKLQVRLLIVLRDYDEEAHDEVKCRKKISDSIGNDFDYDIVFLEHFRYRKEQFEKGIIALKNSKILDWSIPKRDSIKELLPFWATMWIKINDHDQIIFTFVESLKKERDDEKKRNEL